LADGLEGSKASPRKRIILPIHRTGDSAVQRMLNFMQPESFVRPHCHPLPGAAETLMVLNGKLACYIFKENGGLEARYDLAPGTVGNLLDIEPGVYHTMLPIEENTIVLEIKRGPYDAATDKSFPLWSPPEDSPIAQAYARLLLSMMSQP